MERVTVKGWSQDPAWLSHKLTAVVVARSEDRDKGWEALSSRCAIASTASNNRHESPQPPITNLGGAGSCSSLLTCFLLVDSGGTVVEY